MSPTVHAVDALYLDIKQLVDRARLRVLTHVNQTLVLTYWHIGKSIETQVLQGERGACGAEVLEQLARRLTREVLQAKLHKSMVEARTRLELGATAMDGE